MGFTDQLDSLKDALDRAGVRIEDVLARADVHRTTFVRWRTENRVPHLRTWMKVEAAAKQLIAEAAEAARSPEPAAVAAE